MPTITVGNRKIDAPHGKRLVLAIEDGGIPILHRCGGYARCTTCRIEFSSGEPEKMTVTEKERLKADDVPLYGRYRLSCQILCEHDMTVAPALTMANATVSDPGKRPEDHITPDPVEWTTIDYPPKK
jgi:ferredoxin